MTSQDEDRTINGSEEERRLWQLTQGSGIGRRRFLQLLSVGGAAAVLSACGALNLPRHTEKNTAPADVSTPDSP
ncbi:MAG: twin-arginine translocation signal domain-containing protein, partial [Dehalococcoidia bacterium]|nr:twin-arginine translocation signal domain-containing protein [Dehalococcoidia bacterium]